MGRSHAQLAFLSLAPLFPILFLLLFPFISLAARNDQTARKIASAEMDFMQKLMGQFNSAGGAPWPNTAVGYAPTIQEKTCADQDASKLGLEFRLNELEPGEKLIRADLHLFFPASHSRGHSPAVHFSARKERGKLHGKKLPPESIELIRLINCAEDEKVQLKRRPGSLAALADGWATFEAADLVQHSMRDPEGKGRFLVQFNRHGRQLSPAQLSRLLHLHRPFLVVYTDSEEEATSFGGFDGEKRDKREVRARLTNYEEEEAVRQHMETARKTAEYYAYGMARSSPAASDGSGLPVADIPKANKGSMAMLNRRRQKSGKGRRKAVRSYPGFDPNDPMLGFGTRDSPWDRSHRLLQSPNSGNSLNDIRSLRENSYKLEAKQDPGEQGETKVLLLGGAAEQQSQRQQASKCARHNMTVDFRELGWADRIIAPKRFEAGYCAGSCHHPLEQEQKPSNHAILQALIAQLRSKHQQQQAPGTPPPVCCAPEKFDSLTLLYFDERDNVVLKNYQRISVLECACI